MEYVQHCLNASREYSRQGQALTMCLQPGFKQWAAQRQKQQQQQQFQPQQQQQQQYYEQAPPRAESKLPVTEQITNSELGKENPEVLEDLQTEQYMEEPLTQEEEEGDEGGDW